ncbi:MAG: 4-hydroxythreonine-4-phosphate dehydrogenase PdxA [Armatimonadota bacterium]|nr:4-hydroxythreonine-4-phosphate dehydrogenase PdxA [Armatimonadota bacterium]
MKAWTPLLALTMGDPAGIGPEIVVKALAVAEVRQLCRPVVIGSLAVIGHAADQLHLGMKVRQVDDVSEARFEPDQVDVYDPSARQPEEFAAGKGSGHAGLLAVQAAARLALDGRVDGIVTGPIDRVAVGASGSRFNGHSETLAELAGVKDYASMRLTGKLRVVHVTTHVSLREAIERVRQERVLTTIRLAAEGCRRLGIAEPRLAVAALNPLLDDESDRNNEETQEIIPAVEAARRLGIDVEGPLRAETVFLRASCGEFSAVIAMYHDQGQIPSRMFGFKTAVNTTLGLPFVRTGVEHGTALDIAGKGIADPADMVEAIRVVAQMAQSVR